MKIEEGGFYINKQGNLVGPATPLDDPSDFYKWSLGGFGVSDKGQLFRKPDENDVDWSWEVSKEYQDGDEYVGKGMFKRRRKRTWLILRDFQFEYTLEEVSSDIHFQIVDQADKPEGKACSLDDFLTLLGMK